MGKKKQNKISLQSLDVCKMRKAFYNLSFGNTSHRQLTSGPL